MLTQPRLLPKQLQTSVSRGFSWGFSQGSQWEPHERLFQECNLYPHPTLSLRVARRG